MTDTKIPAQPNEFLFGVPAWPTASMDTDVAVECVADAMLTMTVIDWHAAVRNAAMCSRDPELLRIFRTMDETLHDAAKLMMDRSDARRLRAA